MNREALYSPRFVRCMVANFAQAVSFSMFLHLPGFLQAMGARAWLIGVLISLTALSAVVFGPLIGRVMDRRGRRPVLIWGNCLNCCAVALYLGVGTIHLGLWGLQLLHGLAGAMLYAAFFTSAADILPTSRRTQGLALFGASSMLAIAAGGYLGDLAIVVGGYRAVFAGALLAALTALALSWTLKESRPAADAALEPSRRWRDTLMQRDLLSLWLVSSAFFFAMAGVFVFFKIWVLATGLGTLGGFFTTYTLTAILLRLLLGWVPDRVGAQRMVVPSLLCFAAGVATLAGASQLWHVVLAAVLCGTGHGYGFPVLMSLITERTRPAERGAAITIFAAIDEGAVLVAGPVLGLTADAMGYGGMFIVAAGVLTAATLAFAGHIGFNRGRH